MKLNKLFIALGVILAGMMAMPSSASAQQRMDPEEEQKRLYESIDAEISRLESSLELSDWQTFMVDSIYTHDYLAMYQELKDLQSKKVENTHIYYSIQDKWMESIYQAYQKVFDEDQWAKYLKGGAARAKKTRDKRAAEIEKNAAKVKK